MPSVLTGIIGGIQGASAAHNAANAQKQGYRQAADSVNGAVANANPLYSAAASAAGTGVTNATSAAGSGVTGAADKAAAGVTGAAGGANDLLNPYVSAGSSAASKLANLTAAGFSFNPQDLQNDPGYQFQLQQGNKALGFSAASRGLTNSGAALKAAMNYNQGLAGTHYQDGFNRALSTYQTNVSSLLPVASMGYSAAGTAGQNLLNAAHYGGDTGINAATYAGNTGIAGAEYAGNANINAANSQAQNLVNAGVYTGNTQIGTGNAVAQGDIGAANSWNSMLGTIGQAGNQALMMGFGGAGGGAGGAGGPGTSGGWSFGNIGSNLANLYGAGTYGMGPSPSGSFMPYGSATPWSGAGYGGGAVPGGPAPTWSPAKILSSLGESTLGPQ